MFHYWKCNDEKASTAPREDLKETILKYQQEAEEDDPQIGMIKECLAGKDKTCIAQIWESALHFKLKDMKKNDSNDIGAKLIKIGCKRENSARFSGFGSQKAFTVPDDIKNPG